MDYSKPFDAELFPEGCERCSLTKFLAWMSFLGVIFLWGLYAAIRVLGLGLGETGMDDYFGFGLWITFDLAVIALGAGAFFTGALRYILNIDELKNIVNLAAVIGFLCYTGAMMILVLDIGQPIRCWFGYWYPNVHSMLTEVIFCITCYCIVLILEYVPLVLENRKMMQKRFIRILAHNFHVYMPIFAGIGAFLSTFHQGSLGGMYGVLFGRPYLFREGFFIWPWTFFLFVLSAVASGPMFTVLVCTTMEKLSGRKLVSWDVKQLMGRIAGTMLIVYTVFKCLDSWYWAADTLISQGLTFDDMFYGYIYGKWLFWAEHLLLIVPMFVLMVKKLRENPVIFYTMMILVCTSITLNRYLLTVQGLAMPVMPFDEWQTYAPNWVEWACCALVFAYSAMVLSLTYRYTPIFPQEAELNKK
jgi:molybdopterin-containing oxidoreductase family membrane subunit